MGRNVTISVNIGNDTYNTDSVREIIFRWTEKGICKKKKKMRSLQMGMYEWR